MRPRTLIETTGTATRDLLDRLGEVPGERQAVVDGEVELTFDQLRAGAARLARILAARGIAEEHLVALCLPRGADLVLSLIGTLTAGAAYLPVDPSLPKQRRAHLLENAAVDLTIVPCTGDDEGDHTCGPMSASTLPTCAFRDGSADADTGPFLPEAIRPGNLAYVIYTSGSTGRPKGVEVSRGSVSALLEALETEHLTGPENGRVGWNASPSFDASVQQWVRLCRGDTLVLFDEQIRSDPALMAGLIADQALTDIDITPSHADLLLDHLEAESMSESPAGPLTMLIGGEPISPPFWQRISGLVDRGVIRAVNVYGPTECTVDATAGWINSSEEPHIGTVLPGLELRLLDQALRPVPVGEAGEVYLGGPRVARGYRNAPVLTAERFVPDIVTQDGSRMYRTGDLARMRENGLLEYLGRGDRQVKMRGFRIEPGEIEKVLGSHPSVAEAVVDLRETGGGPALVAYFRAQGGCSETELRELASAELPEYMEPVAYLELQEFPRTPNGKLDRAALPAPEFDVHKTADEDDAVLSSTERLIAEVWSKVLGIPIITANDNFFRLGGHSLLAIKLVSQVKAEMGVKIPLKAVYENPELRKLAEAIDART